MNTITVQQRIWLSRQLSGRETVIIYIMEMDELTVE